MPATWNLPRSSNLWDQQDVEQYHRLPVWMAMQQTKKIQYWSNWRNRYSSIKWEQNMGDILQGVISENSPIRAQKHVPKNITEMPNKTVVRHYERSNTARVKRHLFESPLFHFLPSFRDFRKKQLKFAADDLTKQVAVGYDFFTRWQILQQSPYCYITGNTTAGEGPYVPTAAGEATDTTDVKTAAILAALAAKVGPNTGYLDFRQMCAVRSLARNIVQMPAWEGMPGGAPADNEVLKGKFCLTGEPGLYEAMSFDSHVLNIDSKPMTMNLVNSEFSGIISGNIVFKAERYPLLMKADGTFPEPEIEKEVTTTVSSYTNAAKQYETVPNPDYVNAPFGWAFFEGYQAYETVDVGPPPAEFAKGSISMKRFNSLNWNGEVRITDDVLVNYGSGNLDTNKYGEYLQLIADTTLGIIANTPRYLVPVLYRRNLTPSLNQE